MNDNPSQTPLPKLEIPPIPRNCGNCRHGAIGNPQDIANSRICRRFPPRSLLAPGQQGPVVATVWPEVRVKDTCGEQKFQGEGVEGATSQAH